MRGGNLNMFAPQTSFRNLPVTTSCFLRIEMFLILAAMNILEKKRNSGRRGVAADVAPLAVRCAQGDSFAVSVGCAVGCLYHGTQRLGLRVGTPLGPSGVWKCRWDTGT